MKKLIYTIFAASLTLGACSSTESADEKRQDSLAAEAAADSMLNSAMEADSLSLDTNGSTSADTTLDSLNKY